MYKQGDVVLVEGYGGRRATLRIWKVLPRSLQLCTEEHYQAAMLGEVPHVVGFPLADVRAVSYPGERETK